VIICNPVNQATIRDDICVLTIVVSPTQNKHGTFNFRNLVLRSKGCEASWALGALVLASTHALQCLDGG
jgi:hypothetical protein